MIDSSTVYVMLVIHTEPPLNETGKSVPKIMKIAHKYSMPVTWVVTKDVAINFGNPNCPLSNTYGWSLKELSEGTYDRSGIKDEIGAHLHPYIHFGITPEKREDGTDVIDNYAINLLDDKTQHKLIEELTKIISDYANTRPKTFVAGRWAESQDGTTLRILEKFRYTVDINQPFWKPPVGKSDWTGARYYQPYHPNRNNVLELGDSPILSIPQTVLPPRVTRNIKTLIPTDDKVLWPTKQTESKMKNVFDHYYNLRKKVSSIAILIYMHSPDGINENALKNLGLLLSYAFAKKDVAFITSQKYFKMFQEFHGTKNPKKIYSISWFTACLAKTTSSFWRRGKKIFGH